MGHALSLLSLTGQEEQMKLRNQILAHSWSVRTTEADVRTRRPKNEKARRRSAELIALEESLQHALMTRVRIAGNDRNGRIEVTYATADELERLGGLLGGRS
jgi:ParB family transcriptional regulator, chromosome partitioning protein